MVETDNAGEVEEGESSEMPEGAPIKPDDAGIRIDLAGIGGKK